MATTVTRKAMNLLGNRVEDLFDVTIESGDTATDAIATRLSWVESFIVSCRSADGAGDCVDDAVIYGKNTKTESGAEDDPGWVIITGIADPTATVTFTCRAIGW